MSAARKPAKRRRRIDRDAIGILRRDAPCQNERDVVAVLRADVARLTAALAEERGSTAMLAQHLADKRVGAATTFP